MTKPSEALLFLGFAALMASCSASNKGARGKARNRRISIALMPNLKELPDLTTLEAEFGLKEPEEGY